jgi:hypothetical protein
MNKLTKILTAFAMMIALATPLLLVGSASAQTDTQCEGLQGCLDAGASATDPQNAAESPVLRVNSIIELVINIFSIVVGVVAVIMIIIGGLKYITSGGDSNNITAAKNTIIYAIIGLVVVALAQVIVRFVIQRVTDA